MMAAILLLLVALTGSAQSPNISGQWCATNSEECVFVLQDPSSAEVLTADLSLRERVYAKAVGHFRGNRTALAFRRLESAELGFLSMLIRDSSSADVRIYNVDGSLRGQGPYRRKSVAATAPITATRPPTEVSTPTRPSPAAPSSLVGRWNWSCCKGSSSGSFTIEEHGPDGRIRGVFGSSAADGGSPFEGTFANGQLAFTRFITVNGSRQQQLWRAQVTGSGASMRTSGGQWSGYGATTGYTDFQATYAGPR